QRSASESGGEAMKILQRSRALLSYTQLLGMVMAALLGLNATSSRAATEGSKPAPDAAMVAAHAAAKGDGLLEALLTELDRSKSPKMIAVEPTASLKIDEAAWKKTLEDVTSLYKQYPDVQSVTASARFSAINEYLVNSEGTVTRCGKTTYSVQLSGSAQAADGM